MCNKLIAPEFKLQHKRHISTVEAEQLDSVGRNGGYGEQLGCTGTSTNRKS